MQGDWDQFLILLEMPAFQRKMAKARNWGVGFSSQTLFFPPDKTTMEVRNHTKKPCYHTYADEEADPATGIRPDIFSETVTYRIDGNPQDMKYAGFKGVGSLAWEGANLVARLDTDKLGKVRPSNMPVTSFLPNP